MLPQGTDNRKKAGRAVVVGAGEGGDLPFWALTSLAPTLLRTAWSSSELSWGVCVWQAWATGCPAPHPPHLQLIAWPAQGVFACLLFTSRWSAIHFQQEEH